MTKQKELELRQKGSKFILKEKRKVDKFLKLAKSKGVQEGYKKMLKDHDATPETLPKKLREQSNREMQDEEMKRKGVSE